VAGDILDPLGAIALLVRVSDDDDPVDDDRRRGRRDVTVVEGASVRVHRITKARLQVHDTVHAEIGERAPGLGVERDHVVAASNRDDRVPTVDIRVGDTFAVALARRVFPPRVGLGPPHPQRLARRRIDGDHGASFAGYGVELALHVDRSRPVGVVRTGTIVSLAPAPNDLEISEILDADLIDG